MFSKKTMWVAMSVLIVAGMVLAACATPTAEVVEKVVTKEVEKVVKETVVVEKVVEKPKVAGEVRVGGTLVAGALLGMEPKSLNPDFRRDDGALRIAALVYSPLVWADVAHKTGVYPALAKSWDASPDATELTFHLYEGAKWHDGEEVTSADVAWSFNEVIDKKGGAIGYLENVKSIEAPDKYTVKITLMEPDASFISGLGVAYAPFVMPKHLYEGTDWTTNPYNDEPIGSGPFKFVEWVKGSHITLEANEDFFLGRPPLDKFVMRFYSLESLISAFETGDVKYAYDLFPASEILRLRDDPKYRFEMYYPSLVMWLGFNFDKEPFDDARVRQAFAYAIDRKEISQRAYQGLSPANWGTMPRGWAYNDQAEFTYDPERAKQLLDEAGLTPGPDGVRLKATYSMAAVMGNPDIAPVVQEQLKKVGIELTLESMDWAGYVQKVVEQRDFEMGTGGGYAGPDPADFEPFVTTGGYRNMMGYSNERIDELLGEARSTSDIAARKQAYHEIQEILLEDAPRLNFVEYAYHQPVWSEVKNPFFEQSLVGRPYNPYQGFLYTYLEEGQ